MNDQQQQFIQFIRENEKIVFKVLTIYAKDMDDKKDLYQDILLQLWRAYPSFKGQAKASTWVYRIALNTVVSQFRKKKQQFQSAELNEAILQIPDFGNDEMEEPLRLLYQQINLLSDLDKALVLLYLEDKSYDEIAEITGVSTTNVGSRLSRIKQKIKASLTVENAK